MSDLRGAVRERRIRAQDGLSLYVRDYGDVLSTGPTVLCLGGLTRNSKDFGRLAPRLAAAGRRVVCPDYRGRGQSEYDPDWRHYNPRTYVDDMRHLTAALGLHSVLVIGTSLGGVIAMAMAVSMPTVLAGAILNDVGPEVDVSTLAPVIRFMQNTEPAADWEEATRRLRGAFPGFSDRSEEDWQRVARTTYRRGEDGRLRFDWDPNLVRPMLERNEGPVDLWPLFRALARVPVLLLRGANSDLLTADLAERMAVAHPELTLVTVAEAGHAPTLDEPDALRAIDDFVGRF